MSDPSCNESEETQVPLDRGLRSHRHVEEVIARVLAKRFMKRPLLEIEDEEERLSYGLERHPGS